MKRYIVLFIALFFSVCANAQLEVKQDSFKEVPGFVNINVDKMYDDNDKPYAVLKINTENINDKQRHELYFQGNAATFFEIEYKVGEVWVYLSYYATYIKISHPDLSSTEFWFPFDMEPKKGYELTLVNKTTINKNGSGSLSIITSPEDGATISLNGKIINQRTPYFNDMIASGQYEVTVSKHGFESVTRTITIHDGVVDTVNIYMPYLYCMIDIDSEPLGATVFIDNIEYGTTPITINNIIYGTHVLKIKKENHLAFKERFIVNNQEKLVFNAKLMLFPDGAVKGVFSVSDSTKVHFSRGNLQYKASTKTWRFAEHQWDYIGEANKNISSNYKGWIDLFGWGTSGYNNKMPYMTSTDANNYGDGEKDISGTNYDWGIYNTISNSGCKHWRTLTRNELVYLFDQRITNSGIRFAKATVNGIKGVILLPDNWDNNKFPLNKTNEKDASFSSNTISESDWVNILEENGVVFLPVAGIRHKSDVMGIGFVQGSIGCYWSSSYSDDIFAHRLYFNEHQLDAGASNYRDGGVSVRLVFQIMD